MKKTNPSKKKYDTITKLVISTFKKEPEVCAKSMQPIVLKYFPKSKFDVYHYSWYKSQIKNGRYTELFTSSQLEAIPVRSKKKIKKVKKVKKSLRKKAQKTFKEISLEDQKAKPKN